MYATDYMRKLDGDATVGCSCLVRVAETGQVYTAQDKVIIDLPDLDIKVWAILHITLPKMYVMEFKMYTFYGVQLFYIYCHKKN